MRFNRLDLVRYGKFTDSRLAFPHSRRDFHMVVGPNEAGKSTLRQAFYDLLFGFHARTPLDFLHPKSELRLGAVIEQAGGLLEFQRTKGNKNTLRGADDLPLPDATLDPYLGTATGDFFDKMFGLDHPRLVQGGNDMLKAQDDVGQVLFQAAAGVASLGKVYDALQAEASLLWAPKRSKDRQWYIAQAQLDEANAALKAVTVRTREWVEAHKRVQDLQAAVQEQREQHRQLLAKRTRLERIRRLAPGASMLAENERLLRELGPVVELPVDAGAILASAEIELARAEQRLSTHDAEAGRLQKLLSGIVVDERVLALAEDIEALDALRHRYSTHSQNIERYEGEVASLWKDAADAALQLGWKLAQTHTESDFLALQARLPILPARRHIEQLLRDHSSLVQALQSTERAMQSRRSEIETLKARLADLPVVEVQPTLRAALSLAVSQGEPETALRKAVVMAGKAQAEFDQAMSALAGDCRTVDKLMALRTPSAQDLARLSAERQELVSDLKAAKARHVELMGTVQERELAIRQYQQLHHPVTQGDVAQARSERDNVWLSISSGAVALPEAAQAFEQHIGQADALADARLDNVQEAAELQSRQHQLEHELQKRDHARSMLLASETRLQEFDDRWDAICRPLGLQSMTLEQVGDWLKQRDKALAAAEKLTTASQAHEELVAEQSQVVAGLRLALLAAGLPVSDIGSLSALRMQADDYVGAAETAKVRRAALADQLMQAEPILAELQAARDTALGEMDRWRQDWAIALGNAGLPVESDTAAVQGALSLMEIIAEKLKHIRQRHVEHIDVMLSELQGFSSGATQIVQALGDDSVSGDAGQISQALSARLSLARQLHKQVTDVAKQLDHVQSESRLARDSIQAVSANLQPLLQRASAEDQEQLRFAISQSDRQRSLAQAVAHASAELLKNGDGYTREQIQEEIEGADLAQLTADLDTLNADINTAMAEQTRIAVELADAVRKLESISGTDAAAKAESQRQEALSGMADATERYIKVFTAARLLRWSIDRYREEKQGPMLARAGAIFSQLTLGSFERLAVDFDREPMVLEGVRADGGKVGIGGLSDGTRDQLYLALRLAALELHLQQAAPLPFIADDLFINYDDARAKAGLQALAALSEQTQVIFLSHHDHLLDTARSVFGDDMNVLVL